MSKEKLRIHIVDSVKGGSGKSTFSVKLALNIKETADKKGQKKNPCIIDLDLLGTSWYHIYSNFAKIEGYKSSVFLNDLVGDFEYFKNLEYLNQISFLYDVSENSVEIPVIFCNPNPNEKKQFKVSAEKHFASVTYSFFFDAITALVKELENRKYTDIIFDMPPNSEQYSDYVLYEYLKRDDVETYLYMVSSFNLAHIKSTFDWYTDLVKNTDSQNIKIYFNGGKPKDKSTEKSKKSNFYFVFNDNNNTQSFSEIPNVKNELQTLACLSDDKTIPKQLSYYFVDFDSDYMLSTTPFVTHRSKAIKCNSQFEKVELNSLDI